MKKVLKEIRTRGDIILFIDEIHTLVGAGAAEGAIDAASILKPMLARGELQTVGATTIDEYRKHIEKDAALERRFQPVKVEQPSVAMTIEILKGLREVYEEFHAVKITDQALIAAANMSDRYISDRFLPDKAIDLIDEAGSRLRIRRMDTPPAAKKLDEDILRLRRDKESAMDSGALDQAKALDQQEQDLIAKRDEIDATVLSSGGESFDLVDEETIAEVLAVWTGIPVYRLTEEETVKLLRMEDELHKRVIGQDEAVASLSRAIRRTRAGLKDPKRPGGSFIFLGPTGVGKTELAKTLAEFLFDDADALIQLDMSEYMEKHSVSRLVGSPPGYVGYDEGGQLTEAVRRKPFSVVLFDEVEKAHPDVFNTLLQILEDGRLTDSQGRAVDFKNTILIMTSNLGTSDLRKAAIGFGKGSDSITHERMKEKVNQALKAHFRPEFLNRIDDTIVFHELTREEVISVADLFITRLRDQLSTQGLGLELSAKAQAYLAEKGYDPELGARPLRRAIQQYVEDVLSEKILFKEFHAGQTIVVDAAEGDDGTFLTFEGVEGLPPSVDFEDQTNA
jgi:ATP-dependent Clp protease ATP-binding subunit ClpC